MDTYGTSGNAGQSGDNGYGKGTYGVRDNKPPRHRDDINVFVKPGNSNSVSMTANLDWTLDELHRTAASTCRMDPSQCSSTCVGIPLSGPRKVHDTGIQRDSTIFMNVRLRGG